jgi:hypothetical protein
MSRIVTTATATYRQRSFGASNTGKPLTEVNMRGVPPEDGGFYVTMPWTLLDPNQAEPVVGLPWLIAVLHGQWFLTGPVTDIAGEV